MNFNVNYHSSICVNGDVYIDPLEIEGEPHNAKALLLTHGHWDHYSKQDVLKVINENTVILAPVEVARQLKADGIQNEMIIACALGKYDVAGNKVGAFASYNIDKKYHPKDAGGVGYLFEVDGVKYAVCGDSDLTPELSEIRCDVLFVPVGGTYTMNGEEAAKLANLIKPKMAVATHYKWAKQDGTFYDGTTEKTNFTRDLNPDIKVITFS